MQKNTREISVLKERILQYLDKKGVSKYECYQNTGITNGVLSQKSGISEDNILRFLSYYDDINTEWLLLGRGNMMKTENEASLVQKETKRAALNIVAETSPQYISDNIVSIPIVDVAAAAGFGYSNPDYTETLGELSFPANLLKKRLGNYYCGRVDGDSMTPTLLYGDFIIFRLLTPAEWGDIKDGDVYFIVNRAGHAFVKRVKNRMRQEGFIICQSDNPDKINKDFQIQNDDISNIYHVEWRFSKDMTNINQLYFSRLDILEDQMKNLQEIIKKGIR